MKTTTTNNITTITNNKSIDYSSQLKKLNDTELQSYLLQGVSRTFALSIPLLPAQLNHVISNAYLLCRIIDTIEDEPQLDFVQKKEFCEKFVKVVNGQENPQEYVAHLLPFLSKQITEKERELILHIPKVIQITYQLADKQHEAISRCIKTMSEGMIHFQGRQNPNGLSDLAELDHYCYVVAGVVGEMLTDLFCHYSDASAKNYDQMMALAPSFGQGLQMTNILKDIWEDSERSACWLPRSVFEPEGFDLSELRPKKTDDGFDKGLKHLVGVTHAHLKNAFRYTLLISPRDPGLRSFCLLALGLAILTIRKINANRQFSKGEQVKISRKSVKNVFKLTKLFASNDLLLKLFFHLARLGLPLRNIKEE